MNSADDFFMFFWNLLARGVYYLARFIAWCVTSLIFGLHRLGSSPARHQPKDSKDKTAEEARLAGCARAVNHYLLHHGYIARECISKEELQKLIDEGIEEEALSEAISQRILACPGLILGDQALQAQGLPVKQPTSLRDRHTYIIGRSGSGKTNLIRNMIYQDLAQGNGFAVLEFIPNDPD